MLAIYARLEEVELQRSSSLVLIAALYVIRRRLGNKSFAAARSPT
jgi:hypothetical protein